ncbi:hypothetical protein [Pseudogemmobacter humi]|uniref:Lipoprotein n=1 Tax=Pseudogemmobacter humi TaxID=2483812 RepID=A0A3P5WPC7_9RHOB|nr:hypothetical protein [Pseudogemmobacter humi]VDC23618.1 hypothetical protein XINFAN_01125 [Pseudogemmobacter humi]
MLRVIAAVSVALTLAGCGGESLWASDEEVARAVYVAPPPPSVTLFTVINGRTGAGAHTGLLINASQRVLFDPAGTWTHPAAPERNDVHFGMTDRVVNFYRDYHARDTADEHFYIIEHTLVLSPGTAELLMQRAMSNGAVAKANCANSISAILRDVPGFESLPQTYFPKKLGAAFGALPGVTERIVTEENDNPGEGHGVVMVDKKGRRIN